jgi:hypothetical protein
MLSHCPGGLMVRSQRNLQQLGRRRLVQLAAN